MKKNLSLTIALIIALVMQSSAQVFSGYSPDENTSTSTYYLVQFSNGVTLPEQVGTEIWLFRSLKDSVKVTDAWMHYYAVWNRFGSDSLQPNSQYKMRLTGYTGPNQNYQQIITIEFSTAPTGFEEVIINDPISANQIQVITTGDKTISLKNVDPGITLDAYDLLGQRVLHQEAQETVRLDQSPGIYTLVLSKGGQAVLTRKVVIN